MLRLAALKCQSGYKMRVSSPTKETDIKKLRQKANYIRRSVIESTCSAGSGHPGGSLSSAEILAFMYFHVLNLKPDNPSWPERDRFVLAKGHAAPALYAALAECGYFNKEELMRLRQMGAMLQGHPDMSRTPGVEASTGSLGQGLSIAVGMALAVQLDGADYGVYALLGDGEMQEGQVWEAAMSAAHYDLNNLITIVDYNNLQIDGSLEDIMGVEPLTDKWQAFGWNVFSVDGHDISELDEAIRDSQRSSGPSIVIARTIKGKGVSFMEYEASWHGKAPSEEQAEEALRQLRGGTDDE